MVEYVTAGPGPWRFLPCEYMGTYGIQPALILHARMDDRRIGGAGDHDMREQRMRVFSDANGTEWTVYEVKKRGGQSESWSYLPAEFGDGWLCFESDVSKRRLTPIPAKWREFSDKQLAELIPRAGVVSRTRPSADDRSTTD